MRWWIGIIMTSTGGIIESYAEFQQKSGTLALQKRRLTTVRVAKFR
jgi:hypothetical protein